MNYQTTSKQRKLRYRLQRALSSVSFNLFHLSSSHNLVIVGQVLLAGSLFFPWFTLAGDTYKTPFSAFLWGTGFMILILVGTLGFLILSNRTKEVLKNRLAINFADHTAILFFGITSFFLIVASIAHMRSFSYFTQGIAFHDAPVFAIIGTLFILFGGILSYREIKREVLSALYIENSQTSDALFEEYRSILAKNDPDKKNMTLPL